MKSRKPGTRPGGAAGAGRGAAARHGRRLVRWVFGGLAFAVAIVAGILLGLLAAYQEDTPFIEQLENYTADATTIVYDANGDELGQFAIQRHVEVAYEDLPEHLKNAFVASEDQRFWGHWGFDAIGIARALVDNLRSGRVVSGASTITQQVARMLFDEREATLERKIKEAITAFRIERAYRKDEILAFFANLSFFGEGNHGVEAAANHYFDKTTRELSVGEAAMLVGLAPNPGRFNPFRSRERAATRRDMVLARMVAEDYLTPEQAAQAQAEPIRLRPRGSEHPAPHFLDMVREYLRNSEAYGDFKTYRGGLRVYTTLDPDMQRAAGRAVEKTLRQHSRRRGFRGIPGNIVDEEADLAAYRDPAWDGRFEPGTVKNGLVVRAGAFPEIRIGTRTATVDPESLRWTRRTADALFRVGDLAPFRILEEDGAGNLLVALDQEPRAQGAFVALDARTGAVRALVGGHDHARSEFNRAIQARRQAGSSFKPFAYGAALQTGRFTPASLILDAPFTWTNPETGEPYSPGNYDQEHVGWITMRRAFEGSRNVPAVRMVHEVGVDRVVEFARSLGLTGDLPPVLSLTLGAADVSLLEMVSAYGAFANRGERMQPYFIERITDRDGRVLEVTAPASASQIPTALAYVVNHMLQGVTRRGTAAAASRRLGRPTGGKTGTTNDYTDAWFIGFDTELVAGVWVGHDEKVTLGDRETGARVALPAWLDFMEAAGTGDGRGFSAPSSVTLARIDSDTGRPAPPGPNTILEAFLPGTEPTTEYDPGPHDR